MHAGPPSAPPARNPFDPAVSSRPGAEGDWTAIGGPPAAGVGAHGVAPSPTPVITQARQLNSVRHPQTSKQ